MSTRPSPRVDRLGTPKTPAIRFTRAMTFVASWFTHLLRSASLLAPCTDLTGYPASGAFTSRLPAGWSPFPLQDITTTATGLLCWRDSHPLEWQLASLHLLLHRDGLAPSTPCRSPGALRFTPESRLNSDIAACPFSASNGLMHRSKLECSAASWGPFKEFGLVANRSQPELFAGLGAPLSIRFVVWPFSPMRRRLIN